jgi:hypothetical protein
MYSKFCQLQELEQKYTYKNDPVTQGKSALENRQHLK